jgi:hypothetical protein
MILYRKPMKANTGLKIGMQLLNSLGGAAIDAGAGAIGKSTAKNPTTQASEAPDTELPAQSYSSGSGMGEVFQEQQDIMNFNKSNGISGNEYGLEEGGKIRNADATKHKLDLLSDLLNSL